MNAPRSIGWLCLLVLAPAAGATVLTVPGEFSTIQAAVDASAPNDIIRVAPGTYAEALELVTHDLTLESLSGASQTFIEPPGMGRTILHVGPALGRNTVIAGFTFRDGYIEEWLGPVRLDGPVQLRYCIFENNVTVTESSSGAYEIGKGGAVSALAPVLVEDCEFRGNRSGYWGGALYVQLEYFPSIQLIVRDNLFVGNESDQGSAFAVHASGEPHETVLIERNTFVDNERGAPLAVVANATIRGNIMYGSGSVYSEAPLVCRLWHHTRESQRGYDYAELIECNVFHDPSWEESWWLVEELCTIDFADNPIVDPLFCDAVNGDYRLQPGSPALSLPCGTAGAFGEGCAIVDVDAGDAPIAGKAHVTIGSAVPLLAGSTLRLDVRLDAPDHVRLEVFDVSGRRLSSSAPRDLDEGTHELSWRPEVSLGGVLFVRVSTPLWSETRKVQVFR